MQRKSGLIRTSLLLACMLAAAATFAAPTAMARGGYHGNDSADVLGALVVGAVIGGVLVAASQQDRGYRGDAYYPAPAYPAQGYYGGYPAQSYGGGYPAYDSGAYYGNAGYGYGGRVNVGVVYSSGRGNGGHRGDDRYRGNRQGHYYSRYGH